jgi:thioredoxin 2
MIRSCRSCGAPNRVPAARLHLAARCGRCRTALPPLDAPFAVRSEQDFDDLVRNASLPVLVDFGASWCAPCRAVSPEIEKIAKVRAGKLIVLTIDTDELPQIAGRFGVRNIPTMILFSGGQEQKRTSGALPARAIVTSLGLAA